MNIDDLTERQKREIEYHVHHAALQKNPTAYDVLTRQKSKWWNHYWVSHSQLLIEDIADKRLLVPGCGTGADAVIAAKLGAKVSAFDISPDMLALAQASAKNAGVEIELQPMAFERLSYPDETFDVVYIRDVLHHCDVMRSMQEVVRVARSGALVVVDELYTHSWLQRMRTSSVGRALYRVVCPIIYGGKSDPYITEDERKLNEGDLDFILGGLDGARSQFFNFAVNRFLPDWDEVEKVDRILMHGLPGRLVAGRFVLSGRVRRH